MIFGTLKKSSKADNWSCSVLHGLREISCWRDCPISKFQTL